jgi:hypothetical protein
MAIIEIESNLEAGIRKALQGPGEVSYILSTYTALFQCRKILLDLRLGARHHTYSQG